MRVGHLFRVRRHSRRGTTGWGELYDAVYAEEARSETLFRIMRDAYGDDYPEEAEPACFVTRTDLACTAQYLSLDRGETLVDLGCGRGGPGLWLARELGADLVGIDLSREAIEQARRRIADFGLQGHARFIVADVCATTLEDGSCHGAVCIDMLEHVPDRAAAVREVARILCSGARFALTWWERTRPEEIDSRRLLHAAGFALVKYAEKSDWRRRQQAVYDAVLAEQATLIEEMGAVAAGMLIEQAKGFRSWSADRRHVFVVGTRV